MRWSKGQGDTWRVFQDRRRHGRGKGHPLCLGEKGKKTVVGNVGRKILQGYIIHSTNVYFDMI